MLGNENNNVTKKLEGDVQYVSNQISLVNQCTEAVFTMVISLMIGPWTDRFGRKPGLILATTGYFLHIIGTIFKKYLFKSIRNLQLYLLSAKG